jgi:hypothetical protein
MGSWKKGVLAIASNMGLSQVLTQQVSCDGVDWSLIKTKSFSVGLMLGLR